MSSLHCVSISIAGIPPFVDSVIETSLDKAVKRALRRVVEYATCDECWWEFYETEAAHEVVLKELKSWRVYSSIDYELTLTYRRYKTAKLFT